MLEGKTPLSNKMLNIFVSGLLIASMVFLTIFILMPLLSVEVLLLHVLMISSSLIGLKNILPVVVFLFSR